MERIIVSCVRKCEAPLNALMMVAVRTLEKSVTSMRLHGAISQNAVIIKYLEDLHSARRSRLQSYFITENKMTKERKYDETESTELRAKYTWPSNSEGSTL
jgi:hypothetical protein